AEAADDKPPNQRRKARVSGAGAGNVTRTPPRRPRRRRWSRTRGQAFRLARTGPGLRLRVSAGLRPASPVRAQILSCALDRTTLGTPASKPTTPYGGRVDE